MLNRKLIAMAGAIAILGAGTQASAFEVLIDNTGGGPGFANASDIVVLANTLELNTSDVVNGWDYSIFCSGCNVTGWTFNYIPAAPPYVPAGNVAWFGTQGAGLQPPFPNQPINGAKISGIGAFALSGVITGTLPSFSTIGWVTVHVTASSGSVATGFSAGEGMSLNGVALTNPTTNSLSWSVIPEPGTAMLLALGLTGIGVMGRRNR